MTETDFNKKSSNKNMKDMREKYPVFIAFYIFRICFSEQIAEQSVF